MANELEDPDIEDLREELRRYNHNDFQVERCVVKKVDNAGQRTSRRALKVIARGSEHVESEYGRREILIHNTWLCTQPNWLVPAVWKSALNKLSSCGHPNIVTFRNLILTQNYVGIEMDLARGGTVADVLPGYRDSFGNGRNLLSNSTDEFAIQVFQQLITAIEFCHQKNIVIRDIKPENILIHWEEPRSRNGQRRGRPFPRVRLADFGLSKDITEQYKNRESRSAVACRARRGPLSVLPCIQHQKRYPFPTRHASGRALTRVEFHENKQRIRINWPRVDRSQFSWFQLRGQELIRQMVAPRNRRISIADVRRSRFFTCYSPPVPLVDNRTLLDVPLPRNHAQREAYIYRCMRRARRIGSDTSSSVGRSIDPPQR